jgi:hypothetical protein
MITESYKNSRRYYMNTVCTNNACCNPTESCVCKDNHLLCCCIDIYCSPMLYTGELVELKLLDDNMILRLVIITHTVHHHYIAPTLTH